MEMGLGKGGGIDQTHKKAKSVRNISVLLFLSKNNMPENSSKMRTFFLPLRRRTELLCLSKRTLATFNASHQTKRKGKKTYITKCTRRRVELVLLLLLLFQLDSKNIYKIK